jgi:hypothetical protein
MIQQLEPSTYLTLLHLLKNFTPVIKALHTLHASKLSLSYKIEDLQYVHITKLI